MTAPERPPLGRIRRVTGTLRFRITALATLVVAALMAITAVTLVVTQRDRLTENLEATMRQRASVVAAVAGKDDAAGVLTGFGDEGWAFQVVSSAGVVLASSDTVFRLHDS